MQPLIYATTGAPVHDVRPAPYEIGLTQASSPSVLVTGVYYVGPAATYYMMALVAQPAFGGLHAIKFFSQVAGFSVPLAAAATLVSIGQQLPMASTGAALTPGLADGVVVIANGYDFAVAQTVYALVYTGHYRIE